MIKLVRDCKRKLVDGGVGVLLEHQQPSLEIKSVKLLQYWVGGQPVVGFDLLTKVEQITESV